MDQESGRLTFIVIFVALLVFNVFNVFYVQIICVFSLHIISPVSRALRENYQGLSLLENLTSIDQSDSCSAITQHHHSGSKIIVFL